MGVLDKGVTVEFDDYAKKAARTMSSEMDVEQAALGLGGEVGECLELVKKWRQHGLLESAMRGRMLNELGDVLWYAAALARECGWTLGQVAEFNVEKLASRYPGGFEKREGEG